MTPAQIVDRMVYRSYKYNRQVSPHITPQEWASIFPQWEAFERQLEQEAKEAAAHDVS